MPKKKVIKESTKEFDVNDLESIEGIGPIRAKSLREKGITTPLDLILLSDEEISQNTGLDVYESGKLLTKVEKTLEEAGIIPITSDWGKFQEFRAKQFHIPTGSTNLDRLLRGGFESQSMTEVFGEDGAGKTQIVISAVVEALQKKINVYFLDCEGTLEQNRLTQVAQNRGYEDSGMGVLHVEVVLDGLRLENAISRLGTFIRDKKIGLVVMDGGTGLFRMEYHEGRGELAPRQNRMKLLHRMKKAALYLNCSVVITNQVMGNPDQYPGAPKIKPVGGYIVGHTVKYRVQIDKRGKTRRVAFFYKSNQDPQYQVEFYLNEAGVSDIEVLPKKKIKEEGFTIDPDIACTAVPGESSLIDKSLLHEKV